MASKNIGKSRKMPEVQKPVLESEEEIWKAIPRLEGEYEVSSQGRVRRTAKILGWRSVRGKYLQVTLPLQPGDPKYGAYTGRRRNSQRVYIHVLVSRAFLGICPPRREVNHIDGDGLNNVPGNLQYVTRSENVAHAWRIGLRERKYGDEAPRSTITNKQRREIIRRYKTGRYSYRRLAHVLGLSVAPVRYTIENQRKVKI